MTSRTAANRYARALLDVAIKEADPQATQHELDQVTALVTGHADLWKALTNPAVPSPRKHGIVEALLPRLQVGPVVQRLLLMLAERDRLALLPEIALGYRDRLLDYQHVTRATITSAVPLAEGQARRLEQNLATLTGRQVVMSFATDPALMGGVVARIGSTVYDGSVKRQLEKMKERLQGAR